MRIFGIVRLQTIVRRMFKFVEYDFFRRISVSASVAGKENILGAFTTTMKRFAEITAKYIGKPFSEMTCMGFLHSIYQDMGVRVPDRFEDLTLDNYMQKFENNPREIQIRMIKVIRSLGTKSIATLPHLGDLLVIAQKKPNINRPGLFPAIYIGKQLAMASFVQMGVHPFKLDRNHRPIVARRMV